VGHFDVPQCKEVCPVDCIPLNPAFTENHETLWAKYRQLQTAKLQEQSLLLPVSQAN
jgi:formate hydrogenlyase subunit 6/NADH:ubiquinone oxidoreductase subunit I